MADNCCDTSHRSSTPFVWASSANPHGYVRAVPQDPAMIEVSYMPHMYMSSGYVIGSPYRKKRTPVFVDMIKLTQLAMLLF